MPTQRVRYSCEHGLLPIFRSCLRRVYIRQELVVDLEEPSNTCMELGDAPFNAC